MKFSDEIINAYIDGELLGSEKIEFENMLEGDAELQKTLESLYALKAQLKNAYESVEPPAKPQYKVGNYRLVASAMALAFTFAMGWFGAGVVQQQTDSMVDANTYNPGMQIIAEQPGKYILHISVRDKNKFKQTLDQAEALMTNYQNNEQNIQLEIIANAGGLDLFRKDASPYVQRVQNLQKRYPNIKFVACSNAIERLQEQGIEPEFINAVSKDETAIDQVVKRIHQGWSYIKI